MNIQAKKPSALYERLQQNTPIIIIDISEIMSEENIQTCMDVAVARVKQQLDDARKGMRSAKNSHGEYAPVTARNKPTRIFHALIGAKAELIGSVLFDCPWMEEMGQYKGNKNPDLQPKFLGQPVECDARGTTYTDSYIYRLRDEKTPDTLLFSVTNLPDGPDCHVGYIFLEDVTKLVEQHKKEWRGTRPGAPYWNVPIKYLFHDFFLDFRNKK